MIAGDWCDFHWLTPQSKIRLAPHKKTNGLNREISDKMSFSAGVIVSAIEWIYREISALRELPREFHEFQETLLQLKPVIISLDQQLRSIQDTEMSSQRSQLDGVMGWIEKGREIIERR